MTGPALLVARVPVGGPSGVGTTTATGSNSPRKDSRLEAEELAAAMRLVATSRHTGSAILAAVQSSSMAQVRREAPPHYDS
jgi:hypothetical protein